MLRKFSTIGAVLVALAATLLGLAAPASAHVTVSSPGATQGGYAVLTFRVPNESTTAATTRVQISFPSAYPISSVLVQAQPGWTYHVTKNTPAQAASDTHGGHDAHGGQTGAGGQAGHSEQPAEVVSEIDWTATDAANGVQPGQFTEFRVSAGPLPKVDVLRFAAIQTYSDGTVTAWNEEPAPGSTAAPGHPKPSLTLAAATAAQHGAAADPAGGSASGSDTIARTLAIVAVALAVFAAGMTVRTAAITRRRQHGQR